MLTQIHISNLITIENLQLELKLGTSVITGESGVGKSILIDAIELALGARANADMVRTGQEKADISLCFDLTKLPDARNWLKSYDLEADINECMIRRTLYRDGRSRSYINNMPTTLQPLRELSELLINIHGQNEHQTLLKPDVQRSLLDCYAGHEDLAFKVQHLASEWQVLNKETSELRARAEERASISEFLKFQLQELEALQITQNEFAALDLEHKQLANADELLQHINQAVLSLAENEEHNAIRLVNDTIRALEIISRVDPKITTWIETLKSALIQLSDTEDELRRYLDSVSVDPAQLQQTEQRLSTLFNLARKHKIDPPELYDFQLKMAKELQDLEQSDEKIEMLTKKMQIIEKEYEIQANQLSKKRTQSAKSLAKEITQTMQTLSLPHGKFHIHFEPLEKSQLPAHGLEKIIFHIQTNPDQPLLPLAKVASGGEISRISLAIHIATAKQQTIPALVFDEIDVGVSGQTAEMIGKLLRQLGTALQVFCITHVPQVAVQGHHHLRVEKNIKNNATFTTIKILSPDEKTQEIARMLGGAQITKKTLEHAQEMLESANV